MGRWKSLGTLKSFLWYIPQLSGASILCFHILSSLRAHHLTVGWWLQWLMTVTSFVYWYTVSIPFLHMYVCVCVFLYIYLPTCICSLVNQTWVHLPARSKANLLTLACGEGKYSVYCVAPQHGAEQGEQVARAQKTQTPQRLSGKSF